MTGVNPAAPGAGGGEAGPAISAIDGDAIEPLGQVGGTREARGEEEIAAVRVAHGERGEARHAGLLRGREVAAHRILRGLRRVRGEEDGAIEPLVGREVGEDLGMGHVAPLGVERVLHALQVGQGARRIRRAHGDHGAAGGLGVVDEALAGERRVVEGQAALARHVRPVLRRSSRGTRALAASVLYGRSPPITTSTRRAGRSRSNASSSGPNP